MMDDDKKGDMTQKEDWIDAAVAEFLPRLLPDVVVEIAELIGYPKTLKLIHALGGLDFYMPKSFDNRHADLLAQTLGDDAQVLIERFGGERIYIPRCQAAFIQIRNWEFAREVAWRTANGDSQQAAIQHLAPQYGFSERWAYKILSETQQTQIDLF